MKLVILAPNLNNVYFQHCTALSRSHTTTSPCYFTSLLRSNYYSKATVVLIHTADVCCSGNTITKKQR